MKKGGTAAPITAGLHHARVAERASLDDWKRERWDCECPISAYNQLSKHFGWCQLSFCGEIALLTEAEVERSFRKLLKGGPFNQEVFEKGEALLEQLRPESPLRHRLTSELEELRELSISG